MYAFLPAMHIYVYTHIYTLHIAGRIGGHEFQLNILNCIGGHEFHSYFGELKWQF